MKKVGSAKCRVPWNSQSYNLKRALGESLKSNSTLKTLDLEETSIGDSGACALSDSLKSNSTLTQLYLGSNSIGQILVKQIDDELAKNRGLFFVFGLLRMAMIQNNPLTNFRSKFHKTASRRRGLQAKAGEREARKRKARKT